MTQSHDNSAAQPEPSLPKRAASRHRHRRSCRRGQEHSRRPSRPPLRLPQPRNRGNVPCPRPQGHRERLRLRRRGAAAWISPDALASHSSPSSKAIASCSTTVDVSRRIREADVTSAASQISIHPRLRAWMVQQQRALGEAGGVVMEGRDIGTAVFPDAEVKIFLDAAPEVRGNRRYRQATPESIAVANSPMGKPRAANSPTLSPPSSKGLPKKPSFAISRNATTATATVPNPHSSRLPTP